MSHATVSREMSPQVVNWLMKVRSCVKEWVEPGTESDDLRKPLYFNPDHLKSKGFLVVPFTEHWDPGLDRTPSNEELQRCQKFYATGFEICRGAFYSSSADGYSLRVLMTTFFVHCLVVPEDESFWIINTSLDYWLLAGPYDLVMEACRGSLESRFFDFIEWVKELGNEFEPGMDFAVFISNLYQQTNSEILRSRPASR